MKKSQPFDKLRVDGFGFELMARSYRARFSEYLIPLPATQIHDMIDLP